ncbi:MAG TPA: hypothetical protein VJA26_02710, partial [Gammaproteobacteria bacterium]|nr:hypothetical protein [Gammaproteobacteria bacterium]
IMDDERPSLAEVAFMCGYQDQAHMTREWNALAGSTPRAWIASELPFLQDYEVAGHDDDDVDRFRFHSRQAQTFALADNEEQV